MSKQLAERVAVLEAQLVEYRKHTDEKLDAILENIAKASDAMVSIQRMQDSLNSRWGFAMLVVSSVGAVILAFKDIILVKLGWKAPQ